MEELFIGVVFVLVVAHFRFREVRFQRPATTSSISEPQDVGDADVLSGEFRRAAFIPPPRANTTAIRYNLYKVAYMLFILAAYLAVVFTPGLRDLIVGFTEQWFFKDTPQVHKHVSIAVLAVAFVYLLKVPIIRRGEEILRFYFYEHAAIPAQQRLVQSRLRNGPFTIEPEILEHVRNGLVSDGFHAGDIVNDNTHSTRSLWTKTAILMEQLSRLRGENRCKVAFATICDPFSGNYLIDDIESRYHALKSDAKSCLKKMREGSEEAEICEEQFRKQCHQHLDNIYRLISLIALRSNYCECDVALWVKQLGFDIEFRPSPLPSLNDLFWLLFILFFAVALPLTLVAGLPLSRALSIEAAYFISILMPIVIAAEWPTIVRNPTYSINNILYPTMSGLAAVAAGILLAIVWNAVGPSFDLMNGIEKYINESRPWSALHFVLAGSLAVLLQFGTYPDIKNLTRATRYQLFGSLRDGIILFTLVASTVMVYVGPTLHELIPERYENAKVMIHVLPPFVAFIIGFIVPTWYRANAKRLEMTWRIKRGKATHTPGAGADDI